MRSAFFDATTAALLAEALGEGGRTEEAFFFFVVAAVPALAAGRRGEDGGEEGGGGTAASASVFIFFFDDEGAELFCFFLLGGGGALAAAAAAAVVDVEIDELISIFASFEEAAATLEALRFLENREEDVQVIAKDGFFIANVRSALDEARKRWADEESIRFG